MQPQNVCDRAVVIKATRFHLKLDEEKSGIYAFPKGIRTKGNANNPV